MEGQAVVVVALREEFGVGGVERFDDGEVAEAGGGVEGEFLVGGGGHCGCGGWCQVN